MEAFNLAADFSDFQKRYPFAKLMAPYGGLVSKFSSFNSSEGFGGVPFHMMTGQLGYLKLGFGRISAAHGKSTSATEMSIGGAGADEKLELARVRALAEALERYAMCVIDDDEYVVASQRELGEEALDLASIPRCSAEEYKTNTMRPADPDGLIRWVKGYSLTENRPRYVPLVMSHIYTKDWPAERFWLQISTGVAAHTDFTTAVVAAICEVIERDAIAMTWLAKLELPNLLFHEAAPAEFAPKLEFANRNEIRHFFFDATTDVGVPTVYLLQLKDGDPNAAQFVNCATGFCAWECCAKLVRESACGRTQVELGIPYPDSFDKFVSLTHGASYMGKPERRGEFDFLLNSTTSRKIGEMKVEGVNTEAEKLRYLVQRFNELGMEILLVDLTTDELRDAGLWVVRAVIPGLVPMTPIHSARFLDHPRLKDYPSKAGFAPVESFNPAPQPFA